eukprot:TRINITY_DN1902_c0_g1_i1.p1 TRINITY_DN1902_c0_g1~~TRINITY_DN1902_c0_g1_i1.p1  ORF type:complete len:126 (+),score=17.75 TRINITY_DN1902_c0_g1_i1:431-808(+)
MPTANPSVHPTRDPTSFRVTANPSVEPTSNASNHRATRLFKPTVDVRRRAERASVNFMAYYSWREGECSVPTINVQEEYFTDRETDTRQPCSVYASFRVGQTVSWFFLQEAEAYSSLFNRPLGKF